MAKLSPKLFLCDLQNFARSKQIVEAKFCKNFSKESFADNLYKKHPINFVPKAIYDCAKNNRFFKLGYFERGSLNWNREIQK